MEEEPKKEEETPKIEKPIADLPKADDEKPKAEEEKKPKAEEPDAEALKKAAEEEEQKKKKEETPLTLTGRVNVAFYDDPSARYDSSNVILVTNENGGGPFMIAKRDSWIEGESQYRTVAFGAEGMFWHLTSGMSAVSSGPAEYLMKRDNNTLELKLDTIGFTGYVHGVFWWPFHQKV